MNDWGKNSRENRIFGTVDTGAFCNEGFHCVCDRVLLLHHSQMVLSIVKKEEFCEKGINLCAQLCIALTSISKLNFRVLKSRTRNFQAGRIRLIAVINPTQGEEQITLKLGIKEFNLLQIAFFKLLDQR
jgi:hypothetical protein